MPIPESLFFAVFAIVAGWFIFRFVKYGGLRGALYGSAIARTVGELALDDPGTVRTTLRVHVLEDGRTVLEVSSRTSLSIRMMGYPMTSGNVDELVALLQGARA
jgi:hypothetical protein